MTPVFRWFLVVVGLINVGLAFILHMDLIGFLIGGLCLAVATFSE
jgi:uncharacterized membrane protein YuzA (DUF378 family)